MLSKLSLSRKLAAIFAAISIIAGVTLTVIAFRVADLDEADDVVDHTYKIIVDVQTATTAMVNQQSGLRGYLLAGEDKFLEAYRRGGADFAAATAEAKETI